PSLSARATNSAASVPPAPTLFSTMTDCFSNSDSGCAMMRETMSVPPPAPKPTITWIGRSAGHSARAGATTAMMNPATTAAATIARFMNFPLVGYWRFDALRLSLLVFDWIAQHADALDLDLDRIA